MTMTVYSLRKLSANDELTVAYIDVLSGKAERQRKLQLIHGFACECERCSLESAAQQQSDEAREKLRLWVMDPKQLSFQDWLDQTADERDADKVQAYAKQLMELWPIFQSEGLMVLRGPMMKMSDLLVRQAIALGQRNKVKNRLGTAKHIWAFGPFRSDLVLRHIDEYERWSEDFTKASGWSTRRPSPV
jgi:hypothetical protein